MDVRAGLGLVTVGVLAGEMLAAGWQPPPALLLGAPLLPLLLRRRHAAVWMGITLAALALGAARMRSVTDPPLTPDHVVHLPLPLRATLAGRVVAPPECRDRRAVLLVAAETVAGRPVSGLVRLAVRRPGRHWRYGDRLRVDTTLRRPRNFEFRLPRSETPPYTTSRRPSAGFTPELSALECGGVPEFGSSVVGGEGSGSADPRLRRGRAITSVAASCGRSRCRLRHVHREHRSTRAVRLHGFAGQLERKNSPRGGRRKAGGRGCYELYLTAALSPT